MFRGLESSGSSSVNLRCPYCGEQAMPHSGKLWLGPGRSVSCERCGKKVGVPWFTMLGCLPTLVLFALAGISGSVTLSIIGYLSLFLPSLISMAFRLVKK